MQQTEIASPTLLTCTCCLRAAWNGRNIVCVSQNVFTVFFRMLPIRYGSINTWTGELMGFRSMGNFNIVNPAERRYIPNPEHMRTSRGRRQCQRIRNDMDESEAGGPTKQCILCNEFGHRDTNCPTFVTGRGRGNRGRRGGRGSRGVRARGRS